jgi:hypothetical protein
MVKLLVKFLVLFVVLCGIGYLAVNALLDPISDKAINFVFENLHSPNLILSEPAFSNARMVSYDAITLDNFSFKAATEYGSASKKTLIARVKIDELTVRLEDFFDDDFTVDIRGLNVTAEGPQAEDSDGRKGFLETVQEGSLTAPIRLNIFGLSEAASQLRAFAVEIKRFSEDGRSNIPIRFTGEEIVTIGDNSFTISLVMQQKGKASCLVANTEDLRFISENVLPKTQTSTSADIEIIANNPIKAPQLFKIRTQATNTASDAFARDPKVPEKAYRHVLWSYLLTREFGSEFAKEVTDAHETGTDPEEIGYANAGADHRQDYINNEAGRIYAARGVNESDILRLVMTDPKVIRHMKN